MPCQLVICGLLKFASSTGLAGGIHIVQDAVLRPGQVGVGVEARIQEGQCHILPV